LDNAACGLPWWQTLHAGLSNSRAVKQNLTQNGKLPAAKYLYIYSKIWYGI